MSRSGSCQHRASWQMSHRQPHHPPKSPQSEPLSTIGPKTMASGMVERFNGRIEEVLQSHHCQTGTTSSQSSSTSSHATFRDMTIGVQHPGCRQSLLGEGHFAQFFHRTAFGFQIDVFRPSINASMSGSIFKDAALRLCQSTARSCRSLRTGSDFNSRASLPALVL